MFGGLYLGECVGMFGGMSGEKCKRGSTDFDRWFSIYVSGDFWGL